MSIHDGVVTVNNDDVQVILGLDEETIRLSAGGVEIGEWAADACSIDAAADGSFTITAEDETLRFVPNDPTGFATAMRGGRLPEPEPRTSLSTTEPESQSNVTVAAGESETPDAKPVTMMVFYGLVVLTAVLGLWALISLIF